MQRRRDQAEHERSEDRAALADQRIEAEELRLTPSRHERGHKGAAGGLNWLDCLLAHPAHAARFQRPMGGAQAWILYLGQPRPEQADEA